MYTWYTTLCKIAYVKKHAWKTNVQNAYLGAIELVLVLSKQTHKSGPDKKKSRLESSAWFKEAIGIWIVRFLCRLPFFARTLNQLANSSSDTPMSKTIGDQTDIDLLQLSLERSLLLPWTFTTSLHNLLLLCSSYQCEYFASSLVYNLQGLVIPNQRAHANTF